MRKLFRWNWTVLCNKNNFITEQNKTSIERFHLLSSQPYWSSKQWNGGHVGVLSQAFGSYWLFSYVDAPFGIIASHVVKTLYIRKLSLLVRRCPGFFFFSNLVISRDWSDSLSFVYISDQVGEIVFQFKENLSFTTVITQISIVSLTEFSKDFSVRRWYKRFPGSLTNNNTYFPFFSFFLTKAMGPAKDMKSLVFNVYFLFSYSILALFKIMKIKECCIGCRKGAGLVRGGAYSSNTVLRKSKAFRFLTFLPTGIKEKKRLGPVALFKISKGWKTKKRNSTNTRPPSSKNVIPSSECQLRFTLLRLDGYTEASSTIFKEFWQEKVILLSRQKVGGFLYLLSKLDQLHRLTLWRLRDQTALTRESLARCWSTWRLRYELCLLRV